MQVYVGSTPPVPSFIVESQSEREFPSQFILDASGTTDEDEIAGNDTLTYERQFSNSSKVRLDRAIEADNSKIRISVEEP